MSGLGEADEQELPVRGAAVGQGKHRPDGAGAGPAGTHRAWERTNPGRPPTQPAGAQPADRRRLPAAVRLPAPTPRCTVGLGSAARAGARAGPFRVSTDGHLRAHPLRPPERPLPARRGGPDIRLERLGRIQVPPRGLLDQPDERPLLWPVFAAERRAMDVNDIPYFTARASSDALIVSPGLEVPGASRSRASTSSSTVSRRWITTTGSGISPSSKARCTPTWPAKPRARSRRRPRTKG